MSIMLQVPGAAAGGDGGSGAEVGESVLSEEGSAALPDQQL